MIDDRIAFGAEFVHEAANTQFIVGVAALQRRHFRMDQRFKFGCARNGALDALVHGRDFTAHCLADGHDAFGGDGFWLCQAQGHFGHGARGVAQVVGARHHDGKGEEEHDRQEGADERWQRRRAWRRCRPRKAPARSRHRKEAVSGRGRRAPTEPDTIAALRSADVSDAPSRDFRMAEGVRREPSLAGAKAGALGAGSGFNSPARAERRSMVFLEAERGMLSDTGASGPRACDRALAGAAASSPSKSMLRAASRAWNAFSSIESVFLFAIAYASLPLTLGKSDMRAMPLIAWFRLDPAVYLIFPPSPRQREDLLVQIRCPMPTSPPRSQHPPACRQVHAKLPNQPYRTDTFSHPIQLMRSKRSGTPRSS